MIILARNNLNLIGVLLKHVSHEMVLYLYIIKRHFTAKYSESNDRKKCLVIQIHIAYDMMHIHDQNLMLNATIGLVHLPFILLLLLLLFCFFAFLSDRVINYQLH